MLCNGGGGAQPNGVLGGGGGGGGGHKRKRSEIYILLRNKLHIATLPNTILLHNISVSGKSAITPVT